MTIERRQKRLLSCGLALTALAVPMALWAQSQKQEAPESLLPPGFGTPTPTPPPARPTPAPGPNQGSVPASPRTQPNTVPGPSTSPDMAPVPPENLPGDINPPEDTASPSASLPTQPQPTEEPVTDTSEDFASSPGAYDLPERSRRSLALIGILGQEQGGFAQDSFTGTDGPYLASLLRNTSAPLISRWGSILLRRALVSQVTTPKRVNGADWAAARAALLLRMGEADNARLLVQSVDTPLYSPRLYDVAMRAYLASADPSGLCPIVTGGAAALDDVKWEMSRAICAALSGETSAAASRIDRLIRQGKAPRIDLLLAEKTVGAGGGRRAVTVEWDGVDTISPWRFGLALATGIEPPADLLRSGGIQYQAWLASAPMISVGGRVAASDTAASLGVLSSSALIDLYSAAYDSPETADDIRARASLLRRAYAAPEKAGRMESMRDLWDRSDAGNILYSNYILTSHAAARFPVSAQYQADTGQLVASMLSAGLDRNAMRWANIAENGSDGWAMLVLAMPDLSTPVEYGSLDNYFDNDTSAKNLKSGFLLAGLAGLGRVSDDDRASFEEDLNIRLTRNSRWANAITTAANADKPAVVAILAAVGMQGSDWSAMSPAHLYYIVRSLKAVGLDAEARMIAAEAIARG